MRTLTDKKGDDWQIAISKESYGALFLLFCRQSDNHCRRYMMSQETLLTTEQVLANMTVNELSQALAEAEPITGSSE